LPPSGLDGKSLDYFDRMLKRARAHTKRRVRPLRPAKLAGVVQRKNKLGEVWTISRRWILYHMLEHQAGHYGQINLLRHQYRCRDGRRGRASA
jgi:hypothetical protein